MYIPRHSTGGQLPVFLFVEKEIVEWPKEGNELLQWDLSTLWQLEGGGSSESQDPLVMGLLCVYDVGVLCQNGLSDYCNAYARMLARISGITLPGEHRKSVGSKNFIEILRLTLTRDSKLDSMIMKLLLVQTIASWPLQALLANVASYSCFGVVHVCCKYRCRK